jgi:RimJ/RimL family protein N-acetyltransferase
VVCRVARTARRPAHPTEATTRHTNRFAPLGRGPSVTTVGIRGGSPVLRMMVAADVPAVLDVQERGSVQALSSVFAQDRYPFPRDGVAVRWQGEVADPLIDCFVVLHHEGVAGFAATRGDELLHFGIAVESWGSGLAAIAHEAVLEHLQAQGFRHIWLRVFTGNGRARRFYEKHEWEPTGDRSVSTFPPHPELMHYERNLG